jgi:hypothetical protein
VSGGATIGKTIFTCVYIEKNIFSRISRPNLIKSEIIVGSKEFKFVQIKGQILFRGEIFT